MESHEEISKIFKALDDPKRIFILRMIQDGELCACDILEKMQITQPTLSHHMKILCDSGFVKGRKEGKWMHYSIDERGIFSAVKFLMSVSPKV